MTTEFDQILSLYFDNVPLDQLDAIKPTYFELMRNVSTGDLDMKRMRGILKRRLTSRVSALESYPSSLYVTVGLV